MYDFNNRGCTATKRMSHKTGRNGQWWPKERYIHSRVQPVQVNDMTHFVHIMGSALWLELMKSKCDPVNSGTGGGRNFNSPDGTESCRPCGT